MKLRFKIILALVSFLLTHSLCAQDLSAKRTDINVEKLTKKLKGRGYSDEEVKSAIASGIISKTEVSAITGQYQQNKETSKNISSRSVLAVPAGERAALIALYNNMGGVNWPSSSTSAAWQVNDPNSDVATWSGVYVTNGHVYALDLKNVVGTIPDLSALTEIVDLRFYRGTFSGGLTGLQNLDKLKLLRIDSQGSGSISNLVSLLPLCDLDSLEELSLTDCTFNSSSIPAQLSNITTLKKIEIISESLNANLSVLGTMPNLTHIKLVCDFAGALPANFSNLINLELIIMTGNSIDDISVLSNLTTLKCIVFGVNNLSEIPSGFSNLENLKIFDVSGNLIDTDFPAFFQDFSLISLHIGHNKFKGIIPPLSFPGQAYTWEIGGNGVIIYSNQRHLFLTNNKFRFADFEDGHSTYLNFTNYSYNAQAKIDTPKIITGTANSSATLKMYEDDRFTTTEKFQWFKGDYPLGVAVTDESSANREFTIPNLNAVSHNGNYYCISKHPQMTLPTFPPGNLILVREPITLNVTSCTPIEGSIFLRDCMGSKNSNCEYTCGNRTAYINFYAEDEELDLTGASFEWVFKSPTGTVLGTSSISTGQEIPFTFLIEGNNTIELTLIQANGCVTFFTMTVSVVSCSTSCTVSNPNSSTIQALTVSLLKHLISRKTAGATDAQIEGTNPLELIQLSHYIVATDAQPRIYNFHSTYNTSNQLTGIRFSFSPGHEEDVIFSGWNNSNINTSNFQLNLTTYMDSETGLVLTDYANGNFFIKNIKVKHVNFCPAELYCKFHVAIVVDESGSIDEVSEARKIKKQLKLFMEQQAYDNDNLGTNMHVSLIGLADSDAVTGRNDEIVGAAKITASNLGDYNDWINKYRNRDYTIPGVSPDSDYWNSGLNKALALNPDLVILITDGCQTANHVVLKETIRKFDNHAGDSNGPHLYVIGLENGFYIDEEFPNLITSRKLSKAQNPNYNPEISREAVSENLVSTSNTTVAGSVSLFLRKSLKYLMDYGNNPVPQFPIAYQSNFIINDENKMVDYYGLTDFKIFGEYERYLSNGLVKSGIGCGTFIPRDNCANCVSFQPILNKEYILGAWAKEELQVQVSTYSMPKVYIKFRDSSKEIIPNITDNLLPYYYLGETSGDIIDGWQRIFKKFKVPSQAAFIEIELVNESDKIPVYFDDVRIHPIDGSMKSFVYDAETFKLMSELDENNYSTFYEYDKEGGLIRVKKETAKGVKTIQETRSGNVIKE